MSKIFLYWGHRGGQVQRVHHVLNECLIDRGAAPSLVTLECYIDAHHVTTVQVILRVLGGF